MLAKLLAVPVPAPPTSAPDRPSWADQLEAWATLAGAIIALATAVATIWLLVHQIRETRIARQQAHQERAEGAEDRDLARRDRELIAEERRDAQRAQARTVLVLDYSIEPRSTRKGTGIGHVKAKIKNFGNEPVTEVEVKLFGEPVLVGSGYQRVVHATPVLEPGRTIFVDKRTELPITDEGAVEDAFGVTAEDLIDVGTGVAVYFTDMAGIKWARQYGEQPVRLLDEGEPKTAAQYIGEAMEQHAAGRLTDRGPAPSH